MVKFLIALGIIAFIAVMLYLVWIVYSRLTAKKIMRDGRKKKNFVYNYLSVRFGRNRALRNVSLPVSDPSGQNGRYLVTSELIFLNRGGLFVIKVIPGSGYVENVSGGTWSRYFNDRQYQFVDPFVQNGVCIRAIKQLFRAQRLENVPVHNIVLFTGRKVKFARQMNGLITIDDLTPFMIDLNKDRFLSPREIRMIIKIIKSKQVVLKTSVR